MVMKRKALYSAIALVLAASSTVSHASEQEGWQFELSPYFWWANIDADVDFGDQTTEIDNDLWDDLDYGGMFIGIISYNRFLFYVDYDYMKITDDSEAKNGVGFPLGSTVDMEAKPQIVSGGFGWRFDMWGDTNTIDFIIGARNTTLDLELEGSGQRFSEDFDVTDPIVMLRPTIWLSERWRFNLPVSYGEGDSERTYDIMPEFEYAMSDSFALRFGYKLVHYDIEDGDKYTPTWREYDGDLSGPFLGLAWVFPTAKRPEEPKPEPVAVVAPPLPEKCADGDSDGVCDTADQCPSTSPGKRVGPAGCDCDYTLTTTFAFDSAALTSADKAELDKLADVLKNPQLNFVTGTVNGYTDDAGKDAYNQKLSERRAQSVVDYLHSKGVATGSRLQARGFGESSPVADNTTAEGRAANRRVVISRTDCDAP